MAFPPTPGQKAAGTGKPDTGHDDPASGISVETALAALELHAKSPRAHAAIKTLRDELGAGNTPPKNDGASTPGQRAGRGAPGDSFAANAAKAGAAARFGGKNARG